ALHRRGARLHSLRAAHPRRRRRRPRRRHLPAIGRHGARGAGRRRHERRRRPLRARARPALHRSGLRTAHAARRIGRASADGGGGARGARQVRRAPGPDPGPCRQGTAGGGGELSPARARGRAQIRAARGGAAACAAAGRRRGQGPTHDLAQPNDDGGDALRARASPHRRDGRRRGHRRAVPRHHPHPPGLERAGGWSRQPDSDEGLSMDAITIQSLRNKVGSLVDEMHSHFYRSGYSTIIRESRDFSCVFLDREGRLIVAPPMFFHAPVYRHLVGRILKVYGVSGAIHAGDVFVSNHPYEGGLPHVSDMAFVAPVFADGDIVAFAGSIAHKADVGGAVPGSTSANATEMYHEGLLLPPVKIWQGGQRVPDIERIILTNSRQPDLMRGDIHAQIAVTQMGAARVKALCTRFGAATVTNAFAAILKGAADELRSAIAKLPAGTAAAEGFLDSDGVVVDKPIK